MLSGVLLSARARVKVSFGSLLGDAGWVGDAERQSPAGGFAPQEGGVRP